MASFKLLPFLKHQIYVMALAGLVAGLLYSVGGTIYDLTTVGLNQGTALAYLAIPLMPLYFVAFGLATGLVGGGLYYLLSKSK